MVRSMHKAIMLLAMLGACALPLAAFAQAQAQKAVVPAPSPSPIQATMLPAPAIPQPGVKEEKKEDKPVSATLPEEEKNKQEKDKQSDEGWEPLRQTYLGNIKPYTPQEMPVKLRIANEQDDAETQYVLGYMYQFGEGVEANDAIAQKWYAKATKNRHTKAMLAIGLFYEDHGDSLLATKWLKIAAESGEVFAHYKLGEIYEFGFGEVYSNPKKAFKFYAAAADGGIVVAHLKLGQFYQWGFGTKQDVDQAVFHYKKLIELLPDIQRKQQVETLLAEVYASIASQKEGEERLQWLMKASDLKHLRSIVMIAEYYRADGTQHDMKKAIEWYEKAANMQDPYSRVALGYIYANGTEDMDPDACKAFHFYSDAAEQGNKDAIWNMGNAYYNGLCVEKNYDEAFKWWNRMK